MIRTEISLLDAMAYEVHCNYLSALKLLTDGQRVHLAEELTDAYPRFAWFVTGLE